MTGIEILILLTLLFTKHFIVDFPLQTPYQYLNKGTYGHLGGMLHSWLHAITTLVIVSFFTTPHIVLLAFVIDFVIHYHVDWAKVQINNRYQWGANTHKEFWILLGVDQFLHALTYILIAWIVLIY